MTRCWRARVNRRPRRPASALVLGPVRAAAVVRSLPARTRKRCAWRGVRSNRSTSSALKTELAFNVRLLVSELVTNAVTHGGQHEREQIRSVVATPVCWLDCKYSFNASAGVRQSSVLRGQEPLGAIVSPASGTRAGCQPVEPSLTVLSVGSSVSAST